MRLLQDCSCGTLPNQPKKRGWDSWSLIAHAIIFLSTLCTLIYLVWRITFSVPMDYGWLAIAGNLGLFLMELSGFTESLIHYRMLAHMRSHPLPVIPDEDYPDVDIFIATYNEPCDLLRRTINGCTHLQYPDKNKVHVWVCDDNRRPEMRALAEHINLELLDYGNSELEYLQILYDRIPSLPQVLKYDFGMLGDLWRNIAFRVARTMQ